MPASPGGGEFPPVPVIAAPCPDDTESRRWRVPSSASPVVGESLRQRVPVATSPFVGESLCWRVPKSASPCIGESLRWFGRPLDLRSSVSPGDGETLRRQVPATASQFVGESRRHRLSRRRGVSASASRFVGESRRRGVLAAGGSPCVGESLREASPCVEREGGREPGREPGGGGSLGTVGREGGGAESASPGDVEFRRLRIKVAECCRGHAALIPGGSSLC